MRKVIWIVLALGLGLAGCGTQQPICAERGGGIGGTGGCAQAQVET